MKLRKMASCIAVMAALASVWLDGCGGGSANTVTVTFDGRELWGPDGDASARISVDAWESYLEPA